MNRLYRVLLLLCSALFVGVGVASADTLEFTLTGPLVAVFDVTVDSSGLLTPFQFHTGIGFGVTPTNLTINGLAAPTTDFLGFYNPAVGGGVAIFASGTDMVTYASGPQIYGGTEQNPTFSATGSPIKLAAATAAMPTLGQYSLTIKDLSVVATPEPSVTILLAI